MHCGIKKTIWTCTCGDQAWWLLDCHLRLMWKFVSSLLALCLHICSWHQSWLQAHDWFVCYLVRHCWCCYMNTVTWPQLASFNFRLMIGSHYMYSSFMPWCLIGKYFHFQSHNCYIKALAHSFNSLRHLHGITQPIFHDWTFMYNMIIACFA